MRFTHLLSALATTHLASATTVSFAHNAVWAQEVDNNWQDTYKYGYVRSIEVDYGKVKLWIDGTGCGPYYFSWPSYFGDVLLNDDGCMMQADHLTPAGSDECRPCLAQYE